MGKIRRELLQLAYKRFYGRPRYIFRQVAKVKNPQEFSRKARAGLRILGLGGAHKPHRSEKVA